MKVQKIKESWRVEFRFNHLRYRRKSPENSRAGAEAYLATLRGRLARGESMDGLAHLASQDQTFGQFAQRWFDEYVMSNGKPSTQYSRKTILFPSLIPFFGKMNISKITVSDIERYKTHLQNKRGLANRTINEHLLVFSHCVSTAYEWLQLKGVPPKITWLKCPPPKTDYLSFDESELLLLHAEGITREIILTGLKTGMRVGELIGLQWSSIDWHNKLIIVQYSWSHYAKALGSPKSNRVRHVDMSTDLYEMFLKRKRSTGFVFVDSDGEHFNQHRLGRSLAAVCKKAGLRHIGWHTLRHTFASHLMMRGALIPAVQKLLGHSALEMTMRYIHLAPSTTRAAIDLLNPLWALSEKFGQPVGNQCLEAPVSEIPQKS